MAKGRDPARDKALGIYLEARGDVTNREIANKLDIDEKKIATWKYRDKWGESLKKNGVVLQKERSTSLKRSTTKKKRSTTNKNTTMTAERRKQIKKAKALVVNGATLKEASEQTGVAKSTLDNYSTAEGWIDDRLEKLMKFQERHSQAIKDNKLLRLQLNRQFLENVAAEISQGKTSKTIADKLIINEQTEQLIFEKDRISVLVKQEDLNTAKAIELELKHQEILSNKENDTTQDDGFLAALGFNVKEDWGDES